MPPDSAPATTDDAFLGGKLEILQPARGFRSGIDAVLLAASVVASPGDRVLDVGTGVGVAALCLARRLAGVTVTGVDVQHDLCELARSNARRNGCEDAFTVVEADIRILPVPGLQRHGFDHVMANPPFLLEGRARQTSEPGRARSNMLGPGDLDRWVRFMVTMARSGGTVCLVHRADALSEILVHLDRRVGAIRVRPVHPRSGEPASRVIISGRTGSRAPLSLLPGLVLHANDGRFTEEAEAILRHGAALDV